MREFCTRIKLSNRTHKRFHKRYINLLCVYLYIKQERNSAEHVMSRRNSQMKPKICCNLNNNHARSYLVFVINSVNLLLS